MSLTYGLKSPTDMLAKLRRELGRLVGDPSADHFFNFVVTAYHVIDWIKNDPTAPSAAKGDIGSMYGNTYVAVCRDIANEGKHFTLDAGYKGQVTAKTTAEPPGFGTGGCSPEPFGVGQEGIVVVLIDGRRFKALDFARDVVSAWDVFFKKHGIATA